MFGSTSVKDKKFFKCNVCYIY